MEFQNREGRDSQSRELLLNFNSQAYPSQQWVINVEGMVVEIPEVVIAEIHVNPTRLMGWFNEKFRKAWKDIFPLTETTVREGGLVLSDPTWIEARNPWW